VLRARFGPTIIRAASDLAGWPSGDDRPLLSTGSLGLDLLTGGLPRGGISEYAGRDGAGRETLAAVAMARAQAAGGLVILVDAGGTADPDALTAARVDLAALTLAYPATLAQAQSIVEVLCRCGAADILVIASFSSLLVLPTSIGRPRPGRLLGRWRFHLRGRRTSLLVVNHIVRNQPWTTMEEGALAQEAALRVGLRARGVRIEVHGGVAGLYAEAHVVKHLGQPHSPPIELVMGAAGPDRALELLSLARVSSCLEETPSGCLVGSHRLGGSLSRAATTLRQDPALAQAVERHIRACWATPPAMARAVEA
jgi:hypothetical protein